MNVMGTLRNRITYTVVAAVASILVFGLVLMVVQSYLTLEGMQEEMRENIDYVCEEYDQYRSAGDSMEAWSDQICASYLNMVRYALKHDPKLAYSKDFMDEMVTQTEAQDILFCDREGKVLASAAGIFRELSDEMYAPLFETFESGHMEKLEVFPFSAETRELRTDTNPEEDAGETEEAASDVAPVTSGSIWETTEYGRNNPFPILYALAIDDDVVCVINDFGIARMAYEDQTSVWDSVLKNDIIGFNGYALAWSGDTGEILYHPDESLKAQDVSVLGIDPDEIENGQFVAKRVNDQDVYLYPVYLPELHVWLACAVPIEELTGGESPARLLLWFLFAILTANLAYYAILLLRQKRALQVSIHPFADKKPETPRRIKLLIFTVFCTIVVFLSSFYLQTLYLMISWSRTSSLQVARIESELKSGQLLLDAIQETHRNDSESLTRLAGYYLERHPEEVTTKTLDRLMDILQLTSLTVTDKDGNTVSDSSSYARAVAITSTADSSGSTSTEAGEQSASESADTPTTIEPTDTLSVTIPLMDADYATWGYLTAEYSLTVPFMVQSLTSVSDTLKRFQPGEGGFVFSVDQPSTRFTWFPDEELIGKNALDYGLKESDLQGNLCKYIHIDKQTCYVVTGRYESDLIYIAIPESELLRYRLPVSSSAAITALVLLLVCGLALYTSPHATDEAEVGPSEDEAVINRRETAEAKAFRNLALGAAVLAALIVCMRHFAGNTVDDVLGYVLTGYWERGLNVFALTASLIVTVEGGLALFLLRRFSELMCVMLSVRARTAIRMIVGLVSYAGACLIVYLCLVNFGMDPAALMASAGIISVIIGIGANSLVGDIIAGVFLLVEGNVQVGDMIRVGEFRGIVEDLGIRMVQVLDIATADVKFIRNSEVQNVVHLSMHPANVRIDYLIGFDEDLGRVEAIITEHLKTMCGRIPHIITEPIYQGVQGISDRGVALRIRVQCHDAYRGRVSRAVNRDIYLMLHANGIKVPYPQLTLHDGNAPEGEPPYAGAQGDAGDGQPTMGTPHVTDADAREDGAPRT